MNDPHVVKLIYQLVTEPGFVLGDPPAQKHQFSGFNLLLENRVLTIDVREHYPSVEAARAAIEPHLDAWTIQTEIKTGGRMQFQFEQGDLVDRASTAPRVGRTSGIMATSYVEARATVQTEVIVTSPRYPEPPLGFVASALVKDLWDHWSRSRRSQERLTDMGYRCLSAIEASAGGDRAKAAARYGISRNVLDTLGRLSNVGDRASIRKVTPKTQFRPHTQQERAWMGAAMAKIIQRIGEYEANPAAEFQQIMLADLPPLS